MVDPQTLSVSRKREVFLQTPVKTPSATRRIMPPTSQQSPRTWVEDTPRQVEDQEFGVCDKDYEDGHRWTAHDRTIIAKMEQYLNESDIVQVEVDEQELLRGPEDSENDLRFIVMNARTRKGRLGEFLVASTLGWERRMEEKRRREEE